MPVAGFAKAHEPVVCGPYSENVIIDPFLGGAASAFLACVVDLWAASRPTRLTLYSLRKTNFGSPRPRLDPPARQFAYLLLVQGDRA